MLVVGGSDDVVEDESAIAQHRDPVGHREHLVEAVRDVDQGDALIAQQPAAAEQFVDLRVGQSCRGLVQDEDTLPRLQSPQGAGHRDEGLLDGSERTDQGAGVEVVESDRGQVGNRGRALAAPVDGGGALFVAEGQCQVVGDRHRLDQTEVLVDEAHPGVVQHRGVGGQRQFLPVHADASGCRGVVSGEQLDQGRLPGSVRAEQGVDRTRPKFQIHVVQNPVDSEFF